VKVFVFCGLNNETMSVPFFLNEDNVKQYLDMTAEYDGKWFFEQFKKYIPKNNRVLELGMGPGKDLENIRQCYDVVGSDYSFLFAEMYKRQHPEVKVMILDAITIKTDEHFDTIYSNKVLHHLPQDDLKASIARQAQMLNKDALIFHTFWKGSGSDEYEGLLFNYYEKEDLQALFAEQFEIVALESYQELKEDDSLLLVAKRK